MSTLEAIIRSFLAYAARDQRLAIVAAILLFCAAVWLLDVILGAFVRRVALDPSQRAMLAFAAPYFAVHGFRRGDLGGLRPLGLLRVRYFLRKDWGITDRASALERLGGLLQHGHRGDPDLRDPNQPAADLEFVDRALLAWDGMRIVFVARCCFAVGYLPPDDVWAAVRAAIRLVRDRYRSWADWGRAFVAGRVLWAGGGGSEYESVVESLLADRKSAWNEIAWETAASSI